MLRFVYPYAVLLLLVCMMPAQTLAQQITLVQAVNEALDHNPDVLRVREEWKAAKAGLWEGISPTYPEFFVEYEGIPRSEHSLSNYEGRKMGVVQGLDFPVVYFFRGRWHRFEGRRREAEFQLSRNALVSRVKKGFYRVVLLEKQVQLFEDIVRLTEQNFQKARIRVLAGESSPYDTLKMKVDLAEVENRVLAVEKALDVTRSELGLLLGREKGEPVEVRGELSFSPVFVRVDSLRDLALRYHPAIRKAEARVAQTGVGKHLSWMGLLPKIHLRYFQQELRGQTSNEAWGGEIGLSVPLWFFLRGRGRIRAASYEHAAARFRVESEKRRVLLGVEEAFSKLVVAEKQVLNYRENTLREVEELVRIATRSYEEGEMGYLEVAEALRTLNRIRAGYAEALFNVLAARVDLEKAVGIPVFE